MRNVMIIVMALVLLGVGVCGADDSLHIYVPDCNNHRIIRIDDMTGSGWVSYGTEGSGVGEFYRTTAVAIGPEGRVYIADFGNDRIVRIDNMSGEGWVSLGTEGSGIGELSGPRGIDIVGPDGKIYVSDCNNNRIVRMDDMSGAGWVSYGGPTYGSGIGEFHHTLGIDVGYDGKIYVADNGNDRIVRIDDMSGAGWISYGSEGSGIGEFIGPFDIEVASAHSGIADKSSLLLNTFSLTAFPNPFNSSCAITAPAGAEIEIYDLRGTLRLRSVPGDNRSLSGVEMNNTRTFIWRPDESIASEIYLIRVRTEDGRMARKRVVLVR